MILLCIISSLTAIQALSEQKCFTAPSTSCPQTFLSGVDVAQVDSPKLSSELVVDEMPSEESCMQPTEVMQDASSSFDSVLPWALFLGGLLLLAQRFTRRNSVLTGSTFYSALTLRSTAVLSLALSVAQIERHTTALESILTLSSKFSEWYITNLEDSPVLTKSLTTAFIQFIGDYMAQLFEAYRIRSETTSFLDLNRNYDLRRALSLSADGMFLSGPLLHYAFELLEAFFPIDEEHASSAALFHVIVNDYVIDTIYLFLSFFFVAVAEGHVKDLMAIFRKDFVATLKASWGISIALIPVEFVCFRYLSVSFRVLAMNFIDILWGAIVSFVAHRSRRKAKACEGD
jgi:hypothetical protein